MEEYIEELTEKYIENHMRDTWKSEIRKSDIWRRNIQELDGKKTYGGGIYKNVKRRYV